MFPIFLRKFKNENYGEGWYGLPPAMFPYRLYFKTNICIKATRGESEEKNNTDFEYESVTASSVPATKIYSPKRYECLRFSNTFSHIEKVARFKQFNYQGGWAVPY